MERDRAVDWARGVAALAMIEGHATHGWASPEAKQTLGYALTRVVATSPLPAFMLLAGMALRLRIGVAELRGERADELRWALCRRGLTVVLWGYAASALYALLDGHQGMSTLLRADVLHVIGLSIAALPLLCLGRGRRVDTAAVARRALWLTLFVVALRPLYYAHVPAPDGVLAYLAAPFVRVPGITQFPLLPMLAWTTLGFVAGDLIARARRRWSLRGVYLGAALLGLCVALACEWATRALLSGEPLSDAHPAAFPNLFGYAARGLVLVALGASLGSWLPERAQGPLTRLGRSSLTAYVFHIPFCYGLLGQPFRGRLDLLQALPLVLLLWLLSYGAVLLLGSPLWRRLSLPALRPGS